MYRKPAFWMLLLGTLALAAAVLQRAPGVGRPVARTPVAAPVPPPTAAGGIHANVNRLRALHTDTTGRLRPDLWQRGIEQLRQLPVALPPGSDGALIWKWKPIGPQPMVSDIPAAITGSPMAGTVVDIAIDPTGPDTVDRIVYIATTAGGVWKTRDAGVTWAPKTDAMPSLTIGALALDPADPTIVYAGTGSLFDGGGFVYSLNLYGAIGIYKSRDGGETWTILNPNHMFDGIQINRMVMPATNVLLVATRRGLYRSVDGGEHFGDNEPACDNGHPVYLGGTYLELISDVRRDTVNPNIVYAAVSGVGLFKSTDGGATFPTNLLSHPGAPALGDYGYVAFAQSFQPDNTTLYANVQSSSTGGFLGLYRYNATTATWVRKAATPSGPSFGCQCYFDQVIGVDPRDANRVLLGMIDLWLSTDGGDTITMVNGEFDPKDPKTVTQWWVHEDFHAIAFSPPSHWGVTKRVRTWVGNDGGVAASNQTAVDWINLNRTLATMQFVSMDIGVGSGPDRHATYGGTWDNGLMQRLSAGRRQTWYSNMGGDGGPVAVSITNARVAYGTTTNGVLLKTITGGRHWVDPASSWFEPPATGLLNRQAGVLVVDKGTDWLYAANGTHLYRSRDQAATFDEIGTFTAGITRIAIDQGELNTVWVGLADGSLESSYDAYPIAAWTHVTIPGAPPKAVSGIEAWGDQVFVVYPGFCGAACPDGTSSRHIFHSMDRGVNWTDISGNLPDVPLFGVKLDASAAPDAILVAAPGGVLRSTDGGLSWQAYGVGIPAVNCFAMAINRDVTPPILRVATYGRSVFELGTCTVPNTTTLRQPPAEATNIPVTPLLKWDGIAGSASYDVEVYVHLLVGPDRQDAAGRGTAPGPAAPGWVLHRQAHVTAASWKVPAPSALEQGTRFQWRARANNGCGPAAWTEMSAFTTCSTPGVPILLSPGDSATGTSIAPTLSWEPVGSASGYVVQVCLDSGCGQVVRQAPVKSGRPGGTQWKVTPALGKTASYWWRVRAGSACGTGTWSAARRFTTGNKLAPGDVAGRSTRD